MAETESGFFHGERHERLQALAAATRDAPISKLFAEDGGRARQYRAEACGWELDYSRHCLNDAARDELFGLARDAGLEAAREGLFNGAQLNFTEGRAAMHTLLREGGDDDSGLLQAERQAVRDCLRRLEAWVRRVHAGEHRGYRGETIQAVVNLGIGGSDLGPRLAAQALAPWHTGDLEVRFCANIDSAELRGALAGLAPARTLFIICSKSLRTEETLNNAKLARQWLLDSGAGEKDVRKHFLAVSANPEAAAAFGIPKENVLPMWDWVGGRFSLWSAVGWSIAFAIGAEGFRGLRAGAAAMDAHFRRAPLESNLPAILSLLEIWYVNYCGARAHAVIPYDHRLRRLPAYLQQLAMESNGKSRDRHGRPLPYPAAPVLWGGEGTNGQHSFHQFLHQGGVLCPVDFILPMRGQPGDDEDARQRLVAHCLSQGQALLLGRDMEAARRSLLARGMSDAQAQALAPHLVIPGNRPSTTLSCERLTPETLGALLALYEHKTFCCGFLWGINSFDQWGVELGKELSGDLHSVMENGGAQGRDPSTDALLERWREFAD